VLFAFVNKQTSYNTKLETPFVNVASQVVSIIFVKYKLQLRDHLRSATDGF